MKDVIERVNKYLEQRRLSRGSDQEQIHGFHIGSEREAILTVDDIRLLVSEARETERLRAMLTQTRDEPTPEMIEAFTKAHDNKAADIRSPTPTEHPEDGGGAVGYGLRAALNAMTGPVMVNTRDSECTVMHIIPPGWQLVPQEPTLAMLDEIKINDSFTVRALLTRYEAMLSNAPQPPKSSFVIRQSRDDDKDPDCPFCGGSGHKDDIPPQVVDGDVVKHLQRMAANSQSVLYSHRTVLANAASEIEKLRIIADGKLDIAHMPGGIKMEETIARVIWTYGGNQDFGNYDELPERNKKLAMVYAGHVVNAFNDLFKEIKIAVDNLVYQEIRYVAVSAGPVSSSMSAGIIKEAEAVLNQRRKILNDLLTP